MGTDELLAALRRRYQRVELILQKHSEWFEIGGLIVLTRSEAERLASSLEPLEQIVASRSAAYFPVTLGTTSARRPTSRLPKIAN